MTFTATATSHLIILRDESCSVSLGGFHDLCVVYHGTNCDTSSIDSLSASAFTICENEADTLTAHGVVLGTGASLTWYTGAGGTGSNLGSNNPNNQVVATIHALRQLVDKKEVLSKRITL